ncbi:hypothetical protein C9374_010724 [Naegleria lovaniensis]|uniref:Uncharacterized protein n=1 Tax=Naegleria lovaniensis TaxID=51637 RepID=A0AA88GFB8_NAELO|nr:uncharacterized protein C9374_010724 [Naegleria lovaniensis]KAG2374440.1 hypothetical protein C9374_010724 [Naegleria lovaniensis]
MFMFHYTSGKRGNTLLQSTTSQTIEKETAILLLKEEQRLRREPRIQKAFTEADDDLDQLEQITVQLQEEAVANVLGRRRNSNLAVDSYFNDFMNAYRNLRGRFKDDPEVNTLTYYFKYDISRACSLELNTHLDLSGIKVVDLMDFYSNRDGANDHLTLEKTRSQELSLTYTTTLSELLNKRNPNNLPVALIGASYS